jgi:hypothetical protein
MKNLLLTSLLLLSTNTFSQGLNLPVREVPKGENISINCASTGAGIAGLSISFNSDQKINSLTKGILTASGMNFYKFDVSVANLEVSQEQLKFDFTGTNIEGSYEVNLENGVPKGDGVIDLTKRPVVGATVFSKYLLSLCSGSVK